MYQYFAFNILYSVIVFIYLYSLKTAPFRIRFRFVMLAMVSWLLPYDLINNFLTQDNTVVFSSAISAFNGTIKQAIVSQVDNKTYMTLLNFITVMTFVGFIWFIKDVVSLKIKLKNIGAKANLYKISGGTAIYEINTDEIFTAGLFNPKIYIGEKYLNSPFTNSIIKHELQHIKSNDQLWLLIITFVQRLLWWNPFVYLLVYKGRELIELSCDQACKEESKDNKYQNDLAQMLVQTNQHSNPLASNFFGKTKHNIFRIKQLSKEFKMNKKHKALILSTALIPFVLMLFVSTASVSSEESNINIDSAKVILNKGQIDLEYSISVKSMQNKREIKTRFFAEFEKKYSLGRETKVYTDSKPKSNFQTRQPFDFDFDLTVKYVDEKSVMINTYLAFDNIGNKVEFSPSIQVENGKEGGIIIEEEGYEVLISVKPNF